MFIRIVFMILLSFSSLFAAQLTLSGGGATLLINGQEFQVPKDHNLTLKPGTMVCFLSGSGTVLIDNKITLNNQNKECYQVPLKSETDLKTLLSSIKEDAIIDTEKKKAPGSSRGLEAFQTVRGIISLPSSSGDTRQRVLLRQAWRWIRGDGRRSGEWQSVLFRKKTRFGGIRVHVGTPGYDRRYGGDERRSQES